MTTTFEATALQAVLSLPQDEDFLALIAIKEPTGLSKLEQVFDFLNSEEHRLACIVYSDDSKPLVLFDGAQEGDKTVLLTMGEDLSFKILKPTKKTKLDFSKASSMEFDLIKASFFATGEKDVP